MSLSIAEAGAEAFPLARRHIRTRNWPAQPPHDGISFDAATGLVTLKAPGGAPSVVPLDTAFTFTGGNQGWFRNSAGLLAQGVTNKPRYQWSANKALQGLLMEKASTNIALNSADLSAGTWTKSNCTIAAATAADGTSRNVRIVEDGTNSIHGVIAGMTVTANTTYCLSAIVEPNGRQFAYMYGINTDQFGAVFDFVNLTTAPIIAGTSTINQRGIVPWGNGKYLIWVSGILNAASTTLNFVGGPASSLAVPAGYTYLGNGSSGINMEYIQVEQGAIPTSRIPTAGSSATRTADVCTRALGSEFSATAGSVAVRGTASPGQEAANQFVYAFGTGTDSILFLRPANSDIARFNPFTASVAQGPVDATFANGSAFKAAMAWAANDLALSFNGASAVTDNSATLGTYGSLNLGSEITPALQGNCLIRSFDYYPTRLANSVLQQLSAP